MRTLGSWIYGFGTFQLLYSCHTYIPCPKMAQHSLNELVKMVAPPEKNDPLVVSELCYLAKWWVFLTYIKWQVDICWDFPVAVCGIYQLQGEWNGWMDGFSREDEDLIDVAMEQTGAWPRRWLKGFQFFRLFARRDHKSLRYFLRCRMVRGGDFCFFVFFLLEASEMWLEYLE